MPSKTVPPTSRVASVSVYTVLLNHYFLIKLQKKTKTGYHPIAPGYLGAVLMI